MIADAQPFGLRLTADEGAQIARIGEMVKKAAQERLEAVHPEDPDDPSPTAIPSGIYGALSRIEHAEATAVPDARD